MRKSFKFRLFPNARQVELLTSQLQSCQRLYNAALEQRRDTWKSHKQSVSFAEQCRQVTDLAKEAEYKNIYSQVLRDVLKRLDKAFHGFFLRLRHEGEKAGYPRFRAFDRYDSITYPQAYNGSIRFRDGKIWFSKIGVIRIKKHREIEGKVKTVTIKREGKHWYVIFSCDEVPVKILSPCSKEIGIDVGLEHFATFSDGTIIENPHHLQQSEKRLTKTQQILSSKKKGTSARRKAKEIVSQVHRKITNQRKDFLHKLSRKLINEHGLIAVEDLNVKGLLQKDSGFKRQTAGLHKSISDAAWAMFVMFLVAKAEEAGRRLVKVEPRGTSRTCSQCGHIITDMLLSQRTFNCPHCNFSSHRDFNAARNILNRALGRSVVA